ncbi:integrase catalytic domain-containing protein [Trichonephila clavipes]|nr:integrase catalytic domain-containing protein [Trichonephila clavipes]
MQINSVNLYSDSTIALAWINSPSNLLKTFVSNRVSQIQQLLRDFQWQHVPSELNPADLISRGLDVKTLATSELWFKGPDFSKLSLPSHRTEQNSSDLTDQFYVNELKPFPKLTLSLNNDSKFLDELLSITNDFFKLIRILAFIFRFFKNSKSTVKETGFLKQREYADAEKSLLKLVQVKYFTTEIAAIKREMCVSVSSTSPHALLNTVRLKYWPIGGRNVARRVVHECVECFRNKPVVVTQIVGDLPAERVTSSSTFLNVGIDLCGPFEMKKWCRSYGNCGKTAIQATCNSDQSGSLKNKT